MVGMLKRGSGDDLPGITPFLQQGEPIYDAADIVNRLLNG
jgi:hypothetical protein